MDGLPNLGMKHPEAKIQKAIVQMLERKGWFVKVMHASDLLSGIPDLYACHKNYGSRWIEVKLPNMIGSRFTSAQKRDFPKILENNIGIWILTAADKNNYERLFKKPNCAECLRAKAIGQKPNV